MLWSHLKVSIKTSSVMRTWLLMFSVFMFCTAQKCHVDLLHPEKTTKKLGLGGTASVWTPQCAGLATQATAHTLTHVSFSSFWAHPGLLSPVLLLLVMWRVWILLAVKYRGRNALCMSQLFFNTVLPHIQLCMTISYLKKPQAVKLLRHIASLFCLQSSQCLRALVCWISIIFL